MSYKKNERVSRYDRTSIVVQAENFGFGPTSIALAVLSNLKSKGIDKYEIVFMGHGVALQLAKLSNLVDRYVNINTSNIKEMEDKKHLLGNVKLFISVVSPTGAIFAKNAGFKVCYIEPLFWFFDSLDRRLLNTDYFFVQRLTDTKEEEKRLEFYHENLIEVGWILKNQCSKSELKALIGKFCKQKEEKLYFKGILEADCKDYIVINFGGVDNMLINASIYPRVILNLLLPAIRKVKKQMTVLVIGGGDTLRDIRESKNEPFENGVWIGTVPPEWALYLVANASNYFLSCGLSSLIEMGLYSRNGFGLPSQNYSQHCQIKKFRDLYKNWESFDYYDYNKEFVVPDFIPEKDGVRIVQQSFIDFVENENAKDYFQQKVEAYLEKSEKAIQISEELHMNCRDGAQEIADILYKDLFKDNYRKIIFAENKNGDTSLFRALYKNSVEEFVQSIEGDCNIVPPRLLEKV